MTCRTCKHWTPGESHDERCHPVDPDTYEPMALLYEVRRCKSPLLQRFDRPAESHRASVCDGSNCAASLLTGPDFGCVNHESREPPCQT